MLSIPIPWSRSKINDYELVDGGSSSPDSTSSCSHHFFSSSDDYHARRAISSSRGKSPATIASQTLHLARRNKRKVTFIVLAALAFVVLQICLHSLFLPPAYIVLEPESYVTTLERCLQDRTPLESDTTRQAIRTNLHALRDPSSPLRASTSNNDTRIHSLVPNTLFSSDRNAAPSDWAPMWQRMGFQPRFYNDDEANAWVENHWRGTEVIRAWREMPRTILRIDMLRYLLLFLEGGTWSDMDTVPSMHFSNWSTEANPFYSLRRPDRLTTWASSDVVSYETASGTASTPLPARLPIRSTIGIECVPTWKSVRGFAELFNLKPLNRHRNLQFVQWTIHMAQHHPIMLDVIRRILETNDIYRVYQMERKRERQRMGWGWHEESSGNVSKATLSQASSSSAIQKTKQGPAPWETIRQQWTYTKGRWRLGWHATSVEEWTGPAAWTDSVVSYIYATTGIRPEDIARISKPIQIADLVILPQQGYNPDTGFLTQPSTLTRVTHLFRGSWKKTMASSRRR